MTWREQEHPRDNEGKFTFKNGGGEKSKTNETPAQILYGKKTKEEKMQSEYRSLLLETLGDRATHADILYANNKKLENKIKELKLNNKITKGTSSIKSSSNSKNGDYGFNKSLLNLNHYYKLSNEYDKEVGDFLHKNTSNPNYYGNDLRHQYVSAIFARNLGQKATKILGNLNEMRDIRSQPGDSEIDQINNEIGRSYAKRYPDMPRQELLKLMLKEHSKNQQIRIQKMKEINKRNLNSEYM